MLRVGHFFRRTHKPGFAGEISDLAEQILTVQSPQTVDCLNSRSITGGSGRFQPKLFQGHTRFATSSAANIGGCHPHQWSRPARLTRREYD